MGTTSRHDRSDVVLRLPRRALKVGGIAFGVGLLLFVGVWWSGRDEAFYKVPRNDQAQALSHTEALPAPMAAGDGVSGMEEPAREFEENANGMAHASQELADAPLARDEPIDALPEGLGDTALPELPDAAAQPRDNAPAVIPGQNPTPQYPPAALSRRETGTVVVRVQIDPAGHPAGVALMQGSGSRDLDRAAMEAVRRWRFQPAFRNGTAVEGSLDIPISFNVQP